MEYSLNKGWTFKRQGEEEIPVDLPHDAMITEERSGTCPNGENSGFFKGGRYTYKRELNVPREISEKSVKLHFEAVYQNSKVFINDILVAAHKYGYTPFDVEIGDRLIPGLNTLRVEVDNSLEPNCRWYSGSGIYRDVTLVVRDKNYIRNLKVKTISIDPAIINISYEIPDKCDSKVVIFDKEGREVYKGLPGDITIAGAKLWSFDNPYLYKITVESDTDRVEIKYGIRSLSWSAKEGMLVNGERVLLRGGCIHHDHGVLGACEYYDSEYRRIKILKEAGFNALRFSHNPASKIALEICDELGMYVMNEVFDGWYTPKTYHDYSRYFKDNWEEDLTAMVNASYNHPCVIMYSVGNEVSETATEEGIRTCKMLSDKVKAIDDTRPTTVGVNVLINVMTDMGVGIYKEKGEYKPEPLPEGKYNEKSGSSFFNALTQKLGKTFFLMSGGKKGEKTCAGVAPSVDILGYNYASSRYDKDREKYPDRIMVGTETMVSDLPYNWKRVKEYKQLLGDFVWSAWDYLGEACFGDWTYDSYPGLPLLAGQGMIDITGHMLASMYYMQVVWGMRAKPYIAVSPLNHAKEVPAKGSWQFTNGLESWNWRPYEGAPATVDVFASGEYVKLYINDRLIDKKKLKDFKATFKVKYASGTIEAKVYDRDGNLMSATGLSTGDEKAHIQLKAERDRLCAGSDDLCYLDIEVLDSRGNLIPYFEDEITLEISGPGRLLGFGSALCKSEELFGENHHKAYRGRAQAVIKATEEKGTICVAANGKGMEEKVSIKVI